MATVWVSRHALRAPAGGAGGRPPGMVGRFGAVMPEHAPSPSARAARSAAAAPARGRTERVEVDISGLLDVPGHHALPRAAGPLPIDGPGLANVSRSGERSRAATGR